VPLAERPLGPATTPEEAFDHFQRAADFEATSRTLAEEPRKRWAELPKWVERCTLAECELDQQLDKLLADNAGRRSLARADLYADLKKPDVFMPGRFNPWLLKSKAITHSEVELTASWASTLPGQPAPQEFVFKAVKEEDEWKLVPHPRFDPTVNMDLLERYTSAKEALLVDVKAGKFKNRQEVLSALSKALHQGKSTAGTPEAVIETYDAAVLAGDADGVLSILAPASHEKIVKSVERSRRYFDSHRAYYEALEEQFPDPYRNDAHARHFLGKSFEGAGYVVGHGLSRHEVLAAERKGEWECAVTVRKTSQYGTSALTEEKLWTLRKLSGTWLIELPADDPRLTHFAEEASLMIIAVNEVLTPRLKAGEFKSLEELDAAKLQERDKLLSVRTKLPRN
jgi:hypothetical protein